MWTDLLVNPRQLWIISQSFRSPHHELTRSEIANMGRRDDRQGRLPSETNQKEEIMLALVFL